MNKEKIKKASDILYDSRIKMNRISNLPNDCVPQSKEDAYAIQENLIKNYISNDKNISSIGKKIGCTNKEAQKQINITEPFYGTILSKYALKNNSTINVENFFEPYIEPEFSFKLNKDIDISMAPYSPPFPFSLNEIYESIDSIIPSLEIVDSRFDNWTNVGVNNLIADNGANAFWIQGDEKKNIDKYNLTDHSVSVYFNDKLIKEGNSAMVLENPLNSLTWLINTLVMQGKKIPKNSYISTGTCTPAIPFNRGINISADFYSLGKVSIEII
mgnify:CR=1 FL=1